MDETFDFNNLFYQNPQVVGLIISIMLQKKVMKKWGTVHLHYIQQFSNSGNSLDSFHILELAKSRLSIQSLINLSIYGFRKLDFRKIRINVIDEHVILVGRHD